MEKTTKQTRSPGNKADPEQRGGDETSRQDGAPDGTRNGGGGEGETLREKAAKKLHGPDANPSQLGDPISLKNETTDRIPTDGERGAGVGKALSCEPSRRSRNGGPLAKFERTDRGSL